MRHTFQAQVVAVFLSVAAALLADHRLLVAEPALHSGCQAAHHGYSPLLPGRGTNPWVSDNRPVRR